MRVQQIPRNDFLTDYWPGLYKPGDHVAAFGPTVRAGKTHLLFQLLGATNREALRTTAFCMKPRDRTVSRWSKALDFKEIPEWPPAEFPWAKPRSYLLWPRHTGDPDIDNPHLRRHFRAAMLDGYRRGNSILFLDEIFGIVGELDLTKELLAIVTRGGGMGCGAWIASQKPSGTQQVSMPGFIFNCPSHFFLSQDNDKRNRRRYSELAGGVDPALIERETLRLGKFEFLYLNASGELAIVES
jgi:hypothetical protein